MLHDSLHSLRAKRVTGTAIFEAKLFQQLTQIASQNRRRKKYATMKRSAMIRYVWGRTVATGQELHC
jgi:hypothetical protein